MEYYPIINSDNGDTVNERIDLYIKNGYRWQYVEGTRMFCGLFDAERHYSVFYGQPIKARWSER